MGQESRLLRVAYWLRRPISVGFGVVIGMNLNSLMLTIMEGRPYWAVIHILVILWLWHTDSIREAYVEAEAEMLADEKEAARKHRDEP